MRLSASQFEALVAEALDDLPEWIRERTDNVAVVVAGWPTCEQMCAARMGREEILLGLYEGVPLAKRGRGYGLVPPDRITLFQGPLQLRAGNEAELVRLMRRTIAHEIAHHFGLSEAQLRHLGC